MTRASIVAMAGLLAYAAPAYADRAPMVAEVQLTERGGIDIVSAMFLPSISINGRAAPGAPTITSVTTGARRPDETGNTSLRIQGQSGETVSMAIPETFQVVRNGGSEALTVRTIMSGPRPSGSLPTLETLSINVAGALTPFSTDLVEPGAYQGALVVVVQYN